MAYILNFTTEAVKDLAWLKKSGNKTAINKLEQFFSELIEHPTTGTGQVEALKGNFSGYWSRRVDKFNRLIYTIDKEIVTVTVVSVLGHYKTK